MSNSGKPAKPTPGKTRRRPGRVRQVEVDAAKKSLAKLQPTGFLSTRRAVVDLYPQIQEAHEVRKCDLRDVWRALHDRIPACGWLAFRVHYEFAKQQAVSPGLEPKPTTPAEASPTDTTAVQTSLQPTATAAKCDQHAVSDGEVDDDLLQLLLDTTEPGFLQELPPPPPNASPGSPSAAVQSDQFQHRAGAGPAPQTAGAPNSGRTFTSSNVSRHPRPQPTAFSGRQPTVGEHRTAARPVSPASAGPAGSASDEGPIEAAQQKPAPPSRTG